MLKGYVLSYIMVKDITMNKLKCVCTGIQSEDKNIFFLHSKRGHFDKARPKCQSSLCD